MPIFVISYDLNRQKDYQTLWDELTRLKCVRALESVWLGSLTGTSDSVLKHLSKFGIDGDDSLMVAQTTKGEIKLKKPYKKALDWLTTP